MRKKGFTLIELLVVIAIIAILAAILFPVFGKARENARRSACMSNMKQMYLALLLYADDYDGDFPQVDWRYAAIFKQNSMNAYITNKEIMWCPSRSDHLRALPDYSKPTSIYHKTTYHILAARGNLTTPAPYFWNIYNTSTPTSDTRVPCPNIDLCGKTVPYSVYSWGTTSYYIAPSAEQPALVDAIDPVKGTWYADWNAATEPGNHNNEGVNVVFLDGHGEWRPAAEVKPRFKFYDNAWAYW